MDAKAECRKKVRAALKALSREERSAFNPAIASAFLASTEYKSANIFLAYSATAHEAATETILQAALRDGKTLGLPHTGADGSALTFYRVTDLAKDLAPGRFGILEPRTELPQISPKTADLILVPGVAFTLKGARLGQGGGFYDRLLASANVTAQIVALAFEVQIVPEFPIEPHDQGVELIFTEKRLIRVS